MDEKKRPRPAKINCDTIQWGSVDGSSKKLRVRRLITRERHGSELLLGVASLDPGLETGGWSFKSENDTKPGEVWYGIREEVYYCIRGRLTLTWEEGEIEFGPNDGVYLAPGWHYYKLTNTGDEPAFFVYSMYPSPK
jgi:mannose-6-phosphate isomerase-like protein (cupin superfamily)